MMKRNFRYQTAVLRPNEISSFTSRCPVLGIAGLTLPGWLGRSAKSPSTIMKLVVVLTLLKVTFATTSNWTNFNELLIFDGHPYGRRAVLVNTDPNEPCQIYGQNNQIQYIENLPDRPTIRMINQQEWLKILNECQDQLLAVNPTPKPVDIHFIYPGTKWCGPGNVANTFDDLGTHVATDICCRDHDNCADKMSPGVCKNGLCNTSIFTKSHCQCDDKLRDCLLNSNDDASRPVGLIYFNVAAITCYQQTPDCANKDFKRQERKHFRGLDQNADPESGWCFIRPMPFRKSRHVLHPAHAIQKIQARASIPLTSSRHTSFEELRNFPESRNS